MYRYCTTQWLIDSWLSTWRWVRLHVFLLPGVLLRCSGFFSLSYCTQILKNKKSSSPCLCCGVLDIDYCFYVQLSESKTNEHEHKGENSSKNSYGLIISNRIRLTGVALSWTTHFCQENKSCISSTWCHLTLFNALMMLGSKSGLTAAVLLYCFVLYCWGDAFIESSQYLIKGQILPPSGWTVTHTGSPVCIQLLPHFKWPV